MKRVMGLTYAIFAYVVFGMTFLAAMGFVGNLVVPVSLDMEPGAGSTPFGRALTINLLLLTIFAAQHSGMARQRFKNWARRLVPEPLERSTYVLASCAALLVLFTGWQPLGGEVWQVEDVAGRMVLYALFALGWMMVLLGTFLTDHLDFFGLRQAWSWFRGRAYTPPELQVTGPYRLVRHPLYLGWILAFWATPDMTLTHLLFALGMTVYILMAIPLEESDLVETHGPAYEGYRRGTPMLIPDPSNLDRAREMREHAAQFGQIHQIHSVVNRSKLTAFCSIGRE